jgi:hypothetical protein
VYVRPSLQGRPIGRPVSQPSDPNAGYYQGGYHMNPNQYPGSGRGSQ